MDLQFYGANCVSLTYKGTRLVLDDNLAELGAKSVIKAGEVALYTMAHEAPAVEAKIVIDQPGEYEIADISIIGIAARAHIDEEGQHTATIYKVIAGDLNVLFTGHVHPDLSEDELEAIGLVDVMFVPVGGSGYTLDPVGALKVIKEVEPKLIIPTHYADKVLKYPMPQLDLEAALKELAMEPKETVAKLRLKPAEVGDITQLLVLERS
ncbi:MAG TPA: MBL fold metallo-hydrolase [Candidatus Saccharimonadales bacterium]|nr:MBL fold metallo-hydrolase [Candidatus Saccharimonadales bacterium]